MNQPVVWILGAGGGVGGCVAQQLSAAGWKVVGSGRDPEKLESSSAMATDGVSLPLDACDPLQVEAAVKQIFADFGRLDAVVVAVGSIFLKPLHATTPEQFTETVNANLLPAFHALRSAIPGMMRQKSGRFVLFSSAAANVGMANHGAIAAAKSAVEGLALAASSTYAKRGIRINTIAPGLTDTPMAESLLADEARRAISDGMHPVGRVGRAEEVAKVASWLVSEAPEWMTGQVIGVDGGLAKLRAQETRKV
jgi:3-oxoacyl-[acyl-carrier protein] reductase